MDESEGIKEAVQVSLKLMEMLQALFGFTFNKAEKLTAFTGKGLGKGIRYIYHLYQSNKMLEGGEKTFQEIAKNRGSLDMAISTVYIEDWNSKEGIELQQYLRNRGVQYVLLDDLTKGDNKIEFMYHASDANRINSLLTEYKKVRFEDAKSTADKYDDLPHDMKQEVNNTFENGLTDLDYKAIEITEIPVWERLEALTEEKKREFVSPMKKTQPTYKEVLIPSVNVKKDLSRNIAFIRCGINGYVVPLNTIQEEVAGNAGSMELKMRCKIDKQGRYLKFNNGERGYVSGNELIENLEQLKNSLKNAKPNNSKGQEHILKTIQQKEGIVKK